MSFSLPRTWRSPVTMGGRASDVVSCLAGLQYDDSPNRDDFWRVKPYQSGFPKPLFISRCIECCTPRNGSFRACCARWRARLLPRAMIALLPRFSLAPGVSYSIPRASLSPASKSTKGAEWVRTIRFLRMGSLLGRCLPLVTTCSTLCPLLGIRNLPSMPAIVRSPSAWGPTTTFSIPKTCPL